MKYPNRQDETRLLGILKEQLCDFAFNMILDYRITTNKISDHALEGTSSMVHDRRNKIIYTSISERSDPEICLKHAKKIGYKPVVFRANQTSGKPFYHTNVVMAIGENFAVVCADGIVKRDRERVLSELRKHQRDVILISMEQTEKCLCGNIFQI